MKTPFPRLARIVALTIAATLAGAAWAQQALTDAEVVKVDKDGGKITLKHGEVKNLSLPAMKMAYHVQDRSVLDRFSAGDKVRFAAEKVGGNFTLTAIQPAK